MCEYWLDIGAGLDAEHWTASAGPAGVRRVAMDPLITTGMIAARRLAPLPPDILRVGAEIRPLGSVEAGKNQSFLPFRASVFTRVHCEFVLHLYLETLDLLVREAHRVLVTGGRFEILLPHFGDPDSERNLQRTEDAVTQAFGSVTVSRHEGPFTTFWADLYRDRTYRLLALRRD